MVAGQQIHRDADAAHGFQRLADVPRCELVVLEDIAGHDHELGTGVCGQRVQTGDDIAARGRIARLRLAVQEVAGHAELPVGGVHESHLGLVPTLLGMFARHRECRSGRRQVR